MPVTQAASDLASRTITFVAEVPAPIEELWRIWADPRVLERWWGPPGFPATVEAHELRPGGIVRYRMTGPDGQAHSGWWEVLTVDAPTRLEFRDGFGDSPGTVSEELPATVTDVDLAPCGGGGTRMTMMGRYASAEALQQMLAMGALEGTRQALEQLDSLFALEP